MDPTPENLERGSQEHTVLIIDDNPTNLGVMSEYLEGRGLTVLVSRDGEGGLERARYARPDIILLDIVMPGLDGFETCRRLKADPATQDIPVIFMTALAGTEDKIKGFELGAVDYVTKPPHQEEVLARVMAHLRIRDLTRRLQEHNARLQKVTDELQAANAALLKRATQLETSRQVGQQVAAAPDLDDALNQAVNLIQTRLGYYFVGVWLLTAAGDSAVLRAGTGPAGQVLREQGFKLPLSAAHSVAKACTTGLCHVTENGDESLHYLAWAGLPDTRLELALPLRVGDKIVGALDIQSDQAVAFGSDDKMVLQTLANQMAIAICHAQLYREDIQGTSTKIRDVRRQVRIAARGTAPVLLYGEDGVGKSTLARAIHSEGARAANPFLAINCQAMPREVMIGEILGYEGGAFDRAPAEGWPGKFELADGGSLFLDDVESLSTEAQAALLQVIDTGYVVRLGGVRLIPVNVRIIAATSLDLEQRAAAGYFSLDLYRRFDVFTIHLPPLRERVEDIPVLVERLLARITQQMDCTARMSDEALDMLCRYPWPGNIRELENVLEQAVAASTEEVIRPQDLPAVVHSRYALRPGAVRPQPVLTFVEAEREAIMRAGWACHGEVTAMAQLLNIGRTTLWRKMKALNITPQDFK